MLLSATATGVPLVAGMVSGQMLPGILGALCGYLLCLNDHFGRLGARILVITMTFGFLVAGFALGNAFQEWETTYRILFTILVYWVGLFGGEGGELERGVLFCTLTILVAHSLPPLSENAKLPLFLSGALGYTVLVSTAVILERAAHLPPHDHPTLRHSLTKSFAPNVARHIHAVSYALTSLISIWFCHALGIERGYWVTITVLLIMRPDRQQSVYKIVQRLIGTAAGVAVFTPLALSLNSGVPFVMLAVAAATAIPWAVRRNYLIVSFIVTILLFALLEIVAVDRSDVHITLVRLYATVFGCGLALGGAAVSKLFETLYRVTSGSR